jgi:hypothetical protein
MTYMIANGVYDVVIASRILGKGALRGGMPLYKYISNRILTFIQNLLMKQKLSEYHTGYRAFSSVVFNRLDWNRYSDDFIFDNQMLAEILYNNFNVGEISCPTKYFKEASSISFRRSIKYGIGVLKVSWHYFFKNKTLLLSKLYFAVIASAAKQTSVLHFWFASGFALAMTIRQFLVNITLH